MLISLMNLSDVYLMSTVLRIQGKTKLKKLLVFSTVFVESFLLTIHVLVFSSSFKILLIIHFYV